jgi:methionyl-tRNA synthetase
MNKFYVTTPIYYINGLPHIGHVFTTVITDVTARYHRLLGDEVFFLTGTDEHGQKAEKAAREIGITPAEMADRIAAPFRSMWQRLQISSDDFIRTTEPRHYEAVKEMWRRAADAGDIYLGAYEGWYCTFDEAFLTEGQLVEGNCPDCNRPVEKITEQSYFFRLSKYQEPLLRFYSEHPDFIAPRSRFNEVINFVKGGLNDLSVSRLKLKWGIPVPNDPSHVIYVWFDALTNYLTGVGFPSNRPLFERYWPADVHFIGKDIIRFHGVFWPAFLMSAGIPLPRQLFVHGWWLNEDAKISKSRGNVIEPGALADKFGVDGLRYFLIREAPIESDSNYSSSIILKRVNSDLANDLGNLVSRSLTMVQRYSDGVIPEHDSQDPPFRAGFEKIAASLALRVNTCAFPALLADIWEVITLINRYIVEEQPWVLAKSADQKTRLDRVLYNTCEALRIIAVLVSPVIPDSADQIWKQLGLAPSASGARLPDLQWGGLKPGTKLGELASVFPRIEEKGEETVSEIESKPESLPEPLPQPQLIGIDEFMKAGLKVAEVKEAEKVKGSKRLLKLTVDLGTETRTLVAGIAEAYTPEELIGRQVVVVTNLKPAKLMGVESQGMVLAASVDGKPVLLRISDPVPNGTIVK